MNASLSTVEATTEQNTQSKKRPIRALKDKDQVIINRQEFAKLWKRFAQQEREFISSVVDLTEELHEKLISRSPMEKIMDELGDMLFTQQEQNELWIQWEKEFNDNDERQSIEKIEGVLAALKPLGEFEKAKVQALLDKEVSSFTDTQKSIRDLAGCLDEGSSEQVLKLIESLVEQ